MTADEAKARQLARALTSAKETVTASAIAVVEGQQPYDSLEYAVRYYRQVQAEAARRESRTSTKE